ncbi:MAG: glycogen synthase GlgA [Pseudomonadota bacterium]|nr:glycogen synthase GlgA [Pseudomonadota bacterium]
MLRVLSIASEAFPLVKTGGLADVAGALPLALPREGVEMRTLLPGYPAVMAKLEQAESVHAYPALMGGPARLLAGKGGGLDLFVLDAPHLYERRGNIYLGPDGRDWADNAFRYAALARAGADLAKGLAPGYVADVAHAHDWQAALVPVYLHYDGGARPGTVLTLHNMAFQGHYYGDLLRPLGLPPEAMAIDGVEYFGGIGFLKGGILFADKVTTVSPTYAREILTPEFGMALDGLLRARAADVEGIVNGIDDEIWNPETDPTLAKTYSALRLEDRAVNRAALQAKFALGPAPDAPLFGVVSRLTSQKGLDLLLACMPGLIARGGQLALLGTGEPALEQGFRALAATYPDQVGCVIGYDETLAHLIQAGVDFLVVPSRFEPCGLTQLCALRYGAAPLVARVGGLADTVVDANEAALTAGVATGVQFYPPEIGALDHAIARAFELCRNPVLMRRLRLNGMRADVSWRAPAKRYAALYEKLRKVA